MIVSTKQSSSRTHGNQLMNTARRTHGNPLVAALLYGAAAREFGIAARQSSDANMSDGAANLREKQAKAIVREARELAKTGKQITPAEMAVVRSILMEQVSELELHAEVLIRKLGFLQTQVESELAKTEPLREPYQQPGRISDKPLQADKPLRDLYQRSANVYSELSKTYGKIEETLSVLGDTNGAKLAREKKWASNGEKTVMLASAVFNCSPYHF